MRGCLRSLGPSALFIVALVGFGCADGAEDVPATAAPTTTGIPIGAPGAQGVSFAPPAPAFTSRTPKAEGIEQKIDPGPEPVIPPSPFGTPPDEEPPPRPPTTKKKPKGTHL